MLDNEGYKHTPRICNTFCFSIATLVTWKRLNVMMLYVHCLSCFPFYISWINSEPLWFTQLKWFEIFEYTLNTNIHTHSQQNCSPKAFAWENLISTAQMAFPIYVCFCSPLVIYCTCASNIQLKFQQPLNAQLFIPW